MPQRKRILLLGDSIRRSYQPLVADRLAGVADVVGPAENGQFSAYTLDRLDTWLSELGAPAIVHWNNGLHDVGHNPARKPVQYPLDAYLANLGAILARLREIEARVVWATTTSVHPDRPWSDETWSWRNEEIDRYNVAALKLMQQEGVPVNDLRAIVAENPEQMLAQDMLHLSDRGREACADAVIRSVSAFLAP